MFRFAAFLRPQMKTNKEVLVWSSRHHEDSANIFNVLDILKKGRRKEDTGSLFPLRRANIHCLWKLDLSSDHQGTSEKSVHISKLTDTSFEEEQ